MLWANHFEPLNMPEPTGTVQFKSWRAPFFPFKILTHLVNTDYQVSNVWPLLRCTNCWLEIEHRFWRLQGWLSILDNNLLFRVPLAGRRQLVSGHGTFCSGPPLAGGRQPGSGDEQSQHSLSRATYLFCGAELVDNVLLLVSHHWLCGNISHVHVTPDDR